MSTLTTMTATEYAALPHAARLSDGVCIVKENGAVDFKAMTERSILARTVEHLGNVLGLTFEQACRWCDRDDRKPESGPLPF